MAAEKAARPAGSRSRRSAAPGAARSAGSRLTSVARAPKGEAALAPFRFRRLDGKFLLTNDSGRFAMLQPADFQTLLDGKLGAGHAAFEELKAKGFVRDQLDFAALSKAFQERSLPLFQPGPSLHMMVVTLRCNQGCRYCHSSAVDPSRTDTDMDLETAKRTVDFILATPNPTVCIEFQGGEPLLNWPIVKFVTRYARLKAKALGKKLIVALVSNFTLMSEERLAFLEDNYVSLCTSLDGPEDLHNRNRPMLGSGAPQKKVVEWIGRIREHCEAAPERRFYLPSALMTTTKWSLTRGKEIIDLYVELGLEQIFIRPLSPIGYAKRVWGEIGYPPEAFVEFYEKSLDTILELNKKGVPLVERGTLVLLTKILKDADPGFMDLRSPAGAVLGCLAYNYDGNIFVSDEGRMVDHQGDPMFRVGSVQKNTWEQVLAHPTTRACVVASTLDNQPMCVQCAYKPYCGVEPVHHYETQQSVWGQIPSSGWCRSHMGIFDVVFRKLQDPEARRIFEAWLEADRCRWEEGSVPGEKGGA